MIYKKLGILLTTTLLLTSCYTSHHIDHYFDSKKFTDPKKIQDIIRFNFDNSHIPLPKNYTPLSAAQVWDKHKYNTFYTRILITTQQTHTILRDDTYIQKIPFDNLILGPPGLHSWPFEPNLPWPPPNAEKYSDIANCHYAQFHIPKTNCGSTMDYTLVIAHHGPKDEIYLANFDISQR